MHANVAGQRHFGHRDQQRRRRETSWTAVTMPVVDQLADEFAGASLAVQIDRRRRPVAAAVADRSSQSDWPRWLAAWPTRIDNASPSVLERDRRRLLPILEQPDAANRGRRQDRAPPPVALLSL